MKCRYTAPVVLAASGAEIFFQNFLTGGVIVLLLGRHKPPPAPPNAVPVAALDDHT